jgi:hypothetical protein
MVPCASILPVLGDTLSQPPAEAGRALNAAPDVPLAMEIVWLAGGLPGVAVNVSDVGETGIVATGAGGLLPPLLPTLPPPLLPLPVLLSAAVRLMVALCELLPRLAVTIAL